MNSLDDDSLLVVLSALPYIDRFRMRRVSTRMRALSGVLRDGPVPCVHTYVREDHPGLAADEVFGT